MRKKLVNILVIIAMLTLTACDEAEPETKQETTINTEVTAEPEEPEQPVETTDDVDIDLTTMSSTFVYSEVFNMIKAPQEYIGKKVKMNGVCAIYVEPSTNKKYYACIVQDATQCCSQGLEFVLDENQYTDSDYPQEGELVTIEGEFSTYYEGDNQYLTMINSVMR